DAPGQSVHARRPSAGTPNRTRERRRGHSPAQLQLLHPCYPTLIMPPETSVIADPLSVSLLSAVASVVAPFSLAAGGPLTSVLSPETFMSVPALTLTLVSASVSTV